MKNKTEHRVRYSDTDHFGVVYYARYLNWFEAGRTEILRELGVSYSKLEEKGIGAPVVEVKANYKKPARYDDLIVIETSIGSVGNSSVRFEYKIFDKRTNELLVEGYTVNVFVNKKMEPIKIPIEVRNVLT